MKTILFLLCLPIIGYSQVAMSFSEAKEKGIYPKVDSIYRSAIHSDSSKAVFKTEEEQQNHIAAYQSFLQGLGDFLYKNGFVWEQDTRCFNRIYMAADGQVEYFLYQFRDLPVEKETEFKRLLSLYINEHKFGITAGERFAQCSPTVYPKSQ